MTLLTASEGGFPRGMVTAVAPHMIPEGAARFIQDAWVHRFGFTDRRGPVQEALGVVALANKAQGIVTTMNPEGVNQIGILNGNGTNGYLSVLSQDYTAKTDLAFDDAFPTSPYRIVDAKPRAGGGVLLGIASQYRTGGTTQRLVLWHGATSAIYTTGTLTSTRGSTAVTGTGTSWSGAVTSGSFLFNNSGQFIGTVASVGSNTSITLLKPALVSVAGGAYTAKPFRGINPRHSTGLLTTSTSSTTVDGSNTKFRDGGLSTGTWDLFRASDGAFIGTVSSVTSNTELTLGANAAVVMEDDFFFAVKRDGDYTSTANSTGKLGFLNAAYANRQWYGSGTTLRFSDPTDADSVDLSPQDGDFVEVTSGTPASNNDDIHAIVPAFNSLLVIKEKETFALMGQTPEQFELRKVTDDGALSGMSAQGWQGGALFAGRKGIYLYDGVEAKNIIHETLGQWYVDAVQAFDPTTYRMWSMIHADVYFLFLEQADPPIVPTKGNVAESLTAFTIAIHLPTNAVSVHKNLNIRGAAQIPDTAGVTWYLVNTSTIGKVCNADFLFEDGNDTITCDGGTAGPDFYLETRRPDLGDPLLKKVWKQIAMEYQVTGDDLKVDVVPGLNDISIELTDTFPVGGFVWDSLWGGYGSWDELASSFATWDQVGGQFMRPARIRFQQRDQFLGFRIYQNSSSVTSVRLGPWQVGFKPLRKGKI